MAKGTALKDTAARNTAAKPASGTAAQGLPRARPVAGQAPAGLVLRKWEAGMPELRQQERSIGELFGQLSQDMTLLDVLIQVGGMTDFADGNGAVLIRGALGGKQFGLRLKDLLKRGDISGNVSMMPGDIAMVPHGAVATTELGPTTTDQCVLVEDRFTLVSLDNYTGDYIEVRLWGEGGKQLAAESLYEED